MIAQNTRQMLVPCRMLWQRALSSASSSQPTMMRAIQVRNSGPASSLVVGNVPRPSELASDEVLVRNRFAGVNFIDTYHRSGLYLVKHPFTLGVEGFGEVIAVGNDVDPSWKLSAGARVVYYLGSGSYAEITKVKASQVCVVPPNISGEVAVTCMTQGMTAHYLACSTFKLGPEHTALVHAAAGGTGQLLLQIAKLKGAKVVGTSSEAKLSIGLALGADEMLPYDRLSGEEIASKVRAISYGGRGADVAYDGVGAATFEISLNSLCKKGTCVLFGNASGPVPPIDPLVLNAKGSLFLTRPKLYDYLESRNELLERCGNLFEWIEQGKLKIEVQQVFPLDQAAAAHQFIEAGKTTGKVLLEIK